MTNKKFNTRRFTLFIVTLILFIFMLFLGIFFYMLSPTGNKNEKVDFVVESGSTYHSLVTKLKDEDLIKSEFFFKIYLKIKNPTNLDAGKYNLNKGMSAGKIIKNLSERNFNNPDVVTVTIPEGKHITEIASILSEKTTTSKEEYLEVWNDPEFITELMGKYWFITDKIQNGNLRYSLEGYFFPSTYELLNKEVTPKYVAYKLLDQMEVILNEYKSDIEASNYSIHEILTMASIVEYEAILDEDRALVAGVFYNRLDDGWKLQSCATVGYAIDEWKLFYSTADLAVNSPYNTYYYSGLPVGPANAPSEKSIEAALYPEKSDYYFFLADVCSKNPKTYFSKTNAEHEQKVKQYLNCN